MGEHLIADVESDGLLHEATKLHMIQLGALETDEATLYCDSLPGYLSLADGLKRLSAAERVIGHNFLTFDMPLINKLYPGTIRREQVQDTLIMARLMTPEERSNSLSNWGQRLGVLKGDFNGPWHTATEEMATYAIQDVHVTRAVFNATKETEGWGESLALEHDVAWAMFLQTENGFGFDLPAAQILDATLRGELADLNATLQTAFPPLTRTSTFTPKVNNKSRGYSKGVPFEKRWEEPFNPSSRHHVAERLKLAGWRPSAFGADGTPTVDEKTLVELPFPEAKLIVTYFNALKLLGMLSDGKNGWTKLVKNGRIHGRVNPNGAVTGRMSHMSPNVAQVSKDPRARALWVPRAGWKLVGCDAEGLEARMLGHFLTRYDGGAFTKMLLEGKKEDATDVHSSNRDAVRKVGLAIDRDGAKTLLYALVYGAGDFKLASTVRDNLRAQNLAVPKVPPKELGKLVRLALARSMRGIDKLSAQVWFTAKTKGYLTGLDGRHLVLRSEHSALNTLLQSAGAVVMKKALQLFMNDGETQGVVHGRDFGLCANVHDEVQMECPTAEVAECYGKEFAHCITQAGIELKVRCPLAGAYAVGENWATTH